MALRVEAWTRPESGSFVRRFPIVDHEGVTYREAVDGSAAGTLRIRADHPRLAELLTVDPTDHSNDVGTFIRVYDGDTPIGGFYADRLARPFGENGIAELSGDGPLSMLDRVVVYPWDYPASPTIGADWVYGQGENLAENPGFEEAVPGFDGSFESGSLGDWTPTPAGGDFNAPTRVEVVTTEAFDGTHSVEVVPTIRHSGIQVDLETTPGERIRVTVRIKEPTAAGKRYTAALKMGAGASDGDPALNQFVYNGWLMAELDNVPRNPAANGLPGGSSDGTWQTITLDMVPGTSQTSTTLVVQYDHHDGSTGPTFYVDAVQVDGSVSASIAPWEPFGDVLVEVETASPISGSRSAKFTAQSPEAYGHGIVYKLTGLTVGVPHTAKVTVDVDASSLTPGQQFDVTLVARRPGGTWYTSHSLTATALLSSPTDVDVTFVPEEDEVWIAVVDGSADFNLPVTVDDVDIREGLPAATIGKIWGDLLADAASDHVTDGRATLGWVTATFDDTVDSDGTSWADTYGLTIKRGATYRTVLNAIADLGYEHRLWYDDTAGQWKLDVWPTGGRGAATAVGLHGVRSGVVAATPEVMRAPGGSVAFVEGDDGVYAEVENPILTAPWGRGEVYRGDRTLGQSAVTSAAADLVSRLADTTTGVKVTLSEPLPHRPLVDYGIGDTVTVTVLGGDTSTRRVVAVVASVRSDGDTTWQVDLGSVVYADDQAGVTTAVATLLRRFDGLDNPARPTVETTSGGTVEAGIRPAIPTVFVASVDAPQYLKDVADYVCDGVDDQEEVQAAIDAVRAMQVTGQGPTGDAIGGRVLLSAGRFNLSADLIVPSAMTIAGANRGNGYDVDTFGSDGTVLNYTATGTAAIDVTGAHVTIRDLWVQHDDPTPNTAWAIRLNYAFAVVIERVACGADNGIWVQGSTDVTIRDCQLDHSSSQTGNAQDLPNGGWVGVRIDEWSDSVIVTDTLLWNWSSGILLHDRSSGVRIVGCTFSGCSVGVFRTTTGGITGTSSYTVVADCTFRDGGGGILIRGDVEGWSIVGCVFDFPSTTDPITSDNYRCAIAVTENPTTFVDVTGLTISGCVIEQSNTYDGIQLGEPNMTVGMDAVGVVVSGCSMVGGAALVRLTGSGSASLWQTVEVSGCVHDAGGSRPVGVIAEGDSIRVNALGIHGLTGRWANGGAVVVEDTVVVDELTVTGITSTQSIPATPALSWTRFLDVGSGVRRADVTSVVYGILSDDGRARHEEYGEAVRFAAQTGRLAGIQVAPCDGPAVVVDTRGPVLVADVDVAAALTDPGLGTGHGIDVRSGVAARVHRCRVGDRLDGAGIRVDAPSRDVLVADCDVAEGGVHVAGTNTTVRHVRSLGGSVGVEVAAGAGGTRIVGCDLGRASTPIQDAGAGTVLDGNTTTAPATQHGSTTPFGTLTTVVL